jgi:hypothetical protein
MPEEEDDDAVVLEDDDAELVELALEVEVEVEVDVDEDPDPELVDAEPPSAPLPPMPVKGVPLAQDAPASTISTAPVTESERAPMNHPRR